MILLLKTVEIVTNLAYISVDTKSNTIDIF
jgi:hypothetical protein